MRYIKEKMQDGMKWKAKNFSHLLNLYASSKMKTD